MRHVSEVIHSSLKWVQPHVFGREWELRRDDDVAATLKFRSAFGTLAEGTSDDGAWTFKRVGFFQTRVTVRAEGATDDQAVFEPNTWKGGGSLRLAGGRHVLVTTNFWQSRIEFALEDDAVLFRYLTEGFARQNATLEAMPALERMPEMPWLLLLGWYLVVMMHQDAAASAVVITG